MMKQFLCLIVVLSCGVAQSDDYIWPTGDYSLNSDTSTSLNDYIWPTGDYSLNNPVDIYYQSLNNTTTTMMLNQMTTAMTDGGRSSTMAAGEICRQAKLVAQFSQLALPDLTAMELTSAEMAADTSLDPAWSVMALSLYQNATRQSQASVLQYNSAMENGSHADDLLQAADTLWAQQDYVTAATSYAAATVFYGFATTEFGLARSEAIEAQMSGTSFQMLVWYSGW